MKKTFLLLILSLFSMTFMYAYDFAMVNGDSVMIYYNSSGTNATVTYQTTSYNSYSGDVVIPNEVVYNGTTYNVISIGSSAFRNCSELTSIIIPNSVASIGDYAFLGCSKLKNVVLEDGTVTLSLGTSATSAIFENCPIENLYLGRNITYYSSSSPFRDKKTLTSITIVSPVTSIGYCAFYGCSELASITIPNSVTSIGSSAFSGCSSLTSMTIPNSVISIEGEVFKGCNKLKNITFEDGTATLSFGATSSFYIAFENCPIENLYLGRNVTYPPSSSPFKGKATLTSLTISSLVTSIGSNAFEDCSGLTSIAIPNSITSIGSSAFSGCSSLQSVSIPNSITSIGNSAFSMCSTLKNIILEDGAETLSFVTSATSVTFENSPIESLYLGRNISYYSNFGHYFSPFKDNTTLASLTISNSVTSIGIYAFQNCNRLTSLTIPNSVTSIGELAFSGCSGLKNIVLEDGTKTLSWHSDFTDCPIVSIYMGRNINYSYAFSPFSGKTTLTSLIIGSFVSSIGDYAFYGCSGLTTLTIPTSVISIGSTAFSGCSSLQSLTVKTIGDYAFYNCSKLTTLNIPNSLTSIEGSTFQNCSGLTSITIPNSIITIGGSAFSGCSSLQSLTIPNSVTSIELYAFSGCSNLKNIVIEDGTEILSMSIVFENCPIESVYMGRNIPYPSSIGISNYPSPFRDKVTLASVIIGNLVTYIGDNAFSGCSKLISLTIGNSVTSIYDHAFSGCSELTLLTIPNSVKTIGHYAFGGCIGLTSLTIPNSVTSIIQSAFGNCSGLKNVILEDGTTTLSFDTYDTYYGNSYRAFENCPIESLYLGRNMSNGYYYDLSKNIHYYSPFKDKVTLASISIGNLVTSIGGNAFEDCINLMEINSKNPTPPQAYFTSFANVDKEKCTLYVPIGSFTPYSEHPVWKQFFNIQEKDFGTTSINNIISDTEISVYVTDNGIKINGCNPLDKISIYTVIGQIVYNSVIGDGFISYPFKKGMVYIIHTPKKSLKIIY